jgi:hypothetical protein
MQMSVGSGRSNSEGFSGESVDKPLRAVSVFLSGSAVKRSLRPDHSRGYSFAPSFLEGGKLSVFYPPSKVMVGSNSARYLGNTAHLKNRMIAVTDSGFGHALGRNSIRGISAAEESAAR